MRRYETIVIAHPSLSQEERQPFFEKLTNLIGDGQGLLVKVDEWGPKRLAYEIKKQTRGYYVLMEYCGAGTLVKELERNIRLDDRALKYMTVCVASDVNPEVVKAEIEAAEKARQETSQGAQGEAAQQAEANTDQAGAASVEGAAQTETVEETSEPVAEEEATDGGDATDNQV